MIVYFGVNDKLSFRFFFSHIAIHAHLLYHK